MSCWLQTQKGHAQGVLLPWWCQQLLCLNICMAYAGFRLASCSPLWCYAERSPLAVIMVRALRGHTNLTWSWVASLSSWIKFNCLQSATKGKAAGVIDLLVRHCLIGCSSLCFKWGLYSCAKFHHQGSKWQASLKACDALKPSKAHTLE